MKIQVKLITEGPEVGMFELRKMNAKDANAKRIGEAFPKEEREEKEAEAVRLSYEAERQDFMLRLSWILDRYETWSSEMEGVPPLADLLAEGQSAPKATLRKWAGRIK